jgi:hypothetical protein
MDGSVAHLRASKSWDEWIAFFDGTVRPLLKKSCLSAPQEWDARESVLTEDGEVPGFVGIRLFSPVVTASSFSNRSRSSIMKVAS